METNKKSNASSSGWAVKIIVIVASALLLLIPLSMVKNQIRTREYTKKAVEEEVAKSFGSNQEIGSPEIKATLMVKEATDKEPMITRTVTVYPAKLEYKADVTTDLLHRSIYDIVVYNSVIEVRGKFHVKEECLKAMNNKLSFNISDFKGLSAIPQMNFGGKTVDFERVDKDLRANIDMPEGARVEDEIPFDMTVKVKGTKTLMFCPLGDETSLTVESAYPHPSFKGEFLPDSRDVRDNGFEATWNVLKINTNNENEVMGVEFVTPADPYQQATRSADYGILIIVLVFAAGLLVEFLTKKKINSIQYIVIGLSLVLFYALLLSFSEFMAFWLAYVVAAAMTSLALMFYFHRILRSRTGYLLGGLVAFMYATNYILLQMETFSLLSGSLLLFVVLAVVMYFTADINEESIV